MSDAAGGQSAPTTTSTTAMAIPTHVYRMQQKTLQQRIEYFFEHLARDRFLRRRLEDSPDGYIEFETLAKFNSIAEITSDVKRIASAIKASRVLEVHPDNTKMRPKEMPELDDYFDRRTVYIERFPRSWTRNEIERLCAIYGKVEYIELPTLPGRSLNKGYAFVEFEHEQSVEQCIQVLNRFKAPRSPDSYFGLSDMRPKSLEHLSFDQLRQCGMNMDLFVISKLEWNRLRAEYLQLKSVQTKVAEIEYQRAVWTHGDPDYTRGCILRFRNICVNTNHGVLSNILGRVASVEYVHQDENETWGLVRYKTAEGAWTAFNDFRQHPTLHSSCGDIQGDLTDDSTVAIQLSYLTEQEELEEWNRVVEARERRKQVRAHQMQHQHEKQETAERRLQKSMQKKKRNKRGKKKNKKETSMDVDPVDVVEPGPGREKQSRKLDGESGAESVKRIRYGSDEDSDESDEDDGAEDSEQCI